ncbi:unnamed protein product [Rangifer tarandus platyrhynchus]|uniref:Uncharacterized protein n=3 Tax=Rangifer tarandus platyrhynchus TaxID=3082113 RepID=A0ACB0DX85_RANTA|nr:unnamed protein product [Rangifer tarandus platyrhynchus]CAI9692831.1 unnamed protein product [Rangifer tarandus platyrhynchus]
MSAAGSARTMRLSSQFASRIHASRFLMVTLITLLILVTALEAEKGDNSILGTARSSEQTASLRAQVLATPGHGSLDLTVHCSNYALSLQLQSEECFVDHQAFPVIEYQNASGGWEEVTSQGKSSLSTINILSVAMSETSYTDPTPTSHLSS